MDYQEQDIYAIQRPHRRLMTLYVMHSLLSGPFLIFTLPVLFFRYHTMRYQFDDEGIHMRWGILFRRQINLTYARIQDIHLTSGILQRWLGLADVKIQTASGSASAEMTLEGLLEYEAIRNFLYARMRGYRQQQRGAARSEGAAPGHEAELVAAMSEIVNEVRATRQALERLGAGERGEQHAGGHGEPRQEEQGQEEWSVESGEEGGIDVSDR